MRSRLAVGGTGNSREWSEAISVGTANDESHQRLVGWLFSPFSFTKMNGWIMNWTLAESLRWLVLSLAPFHAPTTAVRSNSAAKKRKKQTHKRGTENFTSWPSGAGSFSRCAVVFQGIPWPDSKRITRIFSRRPNRICYMAERSSKRERETEKVYKVRSWLRNGCCVNINQVEFFRSNRTVWK